MLPSDWKRIVEVTCPQCDSKRNAELRNRGFVRICMSCRMKNARKEKYWAAVGVGHKSSRTPLYRVWNAMKQRCDSPTCDVYIDYGGRGITYCAEWREFQPFQTWAMSNGYAKGLLLDRIDNDGNYTPDNCRWTESFRSAMNRRTTKASLTDIITMRKMYQEGVRAGVIATLYGISVDRLSDIRETVTWKKMK